MPKIAYATRQDDLLEAVDEYPDYLVDFDQNVNGSFQIRLTDYDTGEVFFL